MRGVLSRRPLYVSMEMCLGRVEPTNQLHGTVLLEQLTVTHVVKTSLSPYMQRERSLPRPQKTATGPYPEPDASIPRCATLVP